MENKNWDKFYIHEKYKNYESYKKLFAPKLSLVYNSSFIQVSIDYTFEQTNARKILRITMSVVNISTTTIKSINITIQENSMVLNIKPYKVSCYNLKSKEVIHQMIYLS